MRNCFARFLIFSILVTINMWDMFVKNFLLCSYWSCRKIFLYKIMQKTLYFKIFLEELQIFNCLLITIYIFMNFYPEDLRFF